MKVSKKNIHTRSGNGKCQDTISIPNVHLEYTVKIEQMTNKNNAENSPYEGVSNATANIEWINQIGDLCHYVIKKRLSICIFRNLVMPINYMSIIRDGIPLLQEFKINNYDITLFYTFN